MNSHSWKTFYNESNRLKKPAKANQLISKKDTTDIKRLLINVLNGFFAKNDIHIGLKAYINNELRNDYIEKMVANPPRLEDSLETWSQHIFGNQKFGIVLIGLEEYSNAFAEKLATIVSPLLEIAGLPLNGLSFLFFMGNYGFTPFGIHKEAIGEDGILFHLGPENKQFYTWDDPKYNSIQHNSEVFHNINEMLPNGKSYNLAPGDAMFIPHYVYHIANTPKFSMSVVLDYINPPIDRFENELIKETAGENLEHSIKYTKPLKLDTPQSNLNNLIDILSIQKKIEIALDRKILSLKSNGGIRRKSNKIKVSIPSTDTFSIKSKKIFQLYIDEKDLKATLIFARGHRLIKKKHPKLPQLINQINEGNCISLISIKQLMEPLWDLIEIYSFIQDLLSVESIILYNEKL